jgi:hypothetical protein
MAATRDDWKTTPLPAARASITLDRTYSADEFARIKQGNVPQEMEEKWFAFYEEPWLYLHRSWTGYGIYQVRFEPADGGGRVAGVLVSRDPEQYRSTDGISDALLLAVLLDRYAGRDTTAAWEQYRASRG